MGQQPQHIKGKPKGYDKTLELLASLSPVDMEKCGPSNPIEDRPSGTPMKAIATSFGHSKLSPIQKLIIETQVAHKIVLVRYMTCAGMTVGIARQHWARAKMLADDYLDRVYPEETAEA